MTALPARPAFCAGLAVAALAGCTDPASDPQRFADQQELANIRVAHIVPRTAPAALVRALRQSCIDAPADLAARRAGLRAAGYIPGAPHRAGLEPWVSDDRRPMVLLSGDGRICAVRAMARAGQEQAIRSAVAGWYPGAAPIMTGGEVGETLWPLPPSGRTAIALSRHAGGPNQNEITVAYLRH